MTARGSLAPVLSYADGEGWYHMPLPAGVSGYVELRSDDHLPALVFISEPFGADSDPGAPMLGTNFETVQQLATLLGLTADPANGLIAIYAFDCQGVPASGVTFTSSAAGSRYYFIGGLPTLVSEAGTDAQGLGGFVNVAPGLMQVDVSAPSGRSIAGTRSSIVRPGWGSVLFARPARSRTRIAGSG